MSNAEVFPPFRPATPASEEKKTRKKREPKPPATPSASDQTSKKRRKPRAATIPIGILPYLSGLKEADVAALTVIIAHLQDVSKRSRVKIVEALSKVVK